MAFHDVDAVARHYAELLAEHGGGSRAVGYESAHGQMTSFLQLARVDGLAPGARVLDVGCGLGALKRFFDARGLDLDYTGWDICAPLVEEARLRHPEATFEHRDILREPPTERFDFVFASGTLNLLMPDHEAWVAAMIRAMWQACDRALVFNLLSARYAARRMLGVDYGKYFYANPALVLAMCLELGGQVLLDHSEMSHIFAVYLYRRNAAPVDRLRAHLGASGGYGPAEKAVVEHYSSLGLLREALAFVASLPETADGCDAAGLLAFELRDEDRMRAAFRRATELEPENAERWRRLATALENAGHDREALPPLERAVALDPQDDETRRRLERLRAALGGEGG